MANLDAPRGLVLLQLEGKVVRTREYAKTAGQIIYKGDLVMRVPAGTVQAYVAGTAPAAGIAIGVAAHHSLAANTDKIAIIDDPEASYVMQTADAYAVADNGLNADIAAAPSANTSLNFSGQEVDMATKAATATLPLKLIELANEINGAENVAGVNADVIVKINSVERGAGTVGIA